MVAAVFSFRIWGKLESSGLQIWFGDDDSMRFAFIRGSAMGQVASILLSVHLELESKLHLSTWYLRMATETNISGFPSSNESHIWLEDRLDIFSEVFERWPTVCDKVESSSHAVTMG